MHFLQLGKPATVGTHWPRLQVALRVRERVFWLGEKFIGFLHLSMANS